MNTTPSRPVWSKLRSIMSASERSSLAGSPTPGSPQKVPLEQMFPWCEMRCDTMPVLTTGVAEAAFVITAAYVFHLTDGPASSGTPVNSVVPMYATPMRPSSPAISSGKTALPTSGGVIRALGDQHVPGVPPSDGLLHAVSIAE